MWFYRLTIKNNDKIHSWIITANRVSTVQKFYERYFHNGDTVWLTIMNGEELVAECYNGEVKKYLESHADTTS